MSDSESKIPDAINNDAHAMRVRVLLVDDQPIVGEAIRRMLISEGDIDYLYCEDPAVAIARAVEFKPTVILQDLVMPEIDGTILLRFFRANPVTSNIPVIVMSSKEESVIKSQLFSLGASDYLVKIPDKIELIARIRAHSRSFLVQMHRDELYRQMVELKVELERKNRELERLSSLDGLTGISNRRHFDDFLEHEWLRAMRDNKPLSLILIDIDHFKTFNDNYGHQGGDEVLRRVAKALESGTRRPADLVSRYGGEEFVVVLPDTEIRGAESVAEGMRAAVESLGIPHAHSDTADHVTISAGVASVVPQEGSQPNLLIEMADEALYEAKRYGRNCYSKYSSKKAVTPISSESTKRTG